MGDDIQESRRERSRAWRAALSAYVEAQPSASALPDGHMLHPLQGWQRRISGGALLELLEWATSAEARARYPALKAAHPIEERVLVFISDLSGLVAFREITDQRSEFAAGLLKSQWRAFLSDPSQDHDEAFAHHYEVWSVWHREIDPHWEIDPGLHAQQLWVHEEGFALADRIGRGSHHLWGWDGREMSLIIQDASKWVY